MNIIFYRNKYSSKLNRLYEIDSMPEPTEYARKMRYYGYKMDNHIISFGSRDSLLQQHNRGMKRADRVLNHLSSLFNYTKVTQSPHKLSPNLYSTTIEFGNYDTSAHNGSDYHKYLHDIGRAESNYRRIDPLTNIDEATESKFNQTPYAINNHTHGLKFSPNDLSRSDLIKLEHRASNYYSNKLHRTVNVHIRHFKNKKGSMSKSEEDYIKYVNKESGLPSAKDLKDYTTFAHKPVTERQHLERVNKQGTYNQHGLHVSIRTNGHRFKDMDRFFKEKTYIELAMASIMNKVSNADRVASTSAQTATNNAITAQNDIKKHDYRLKHQKHQLKQEEAHILDELASINGKFCLFNLRSEYTKKADNHNNYDYRTVYLLSNNVNDVHKLLVRSDLHEYIIGSDFLSLATTSGIPP